MRGVRGFVGTGAGAVALLALGGCAQIDDLVAGITGAEDVASEVLLEPVGDAGPDPFTGFAAPEPDEHLLAFAELGAQPSTDEAAAAERTDPADALVQRDGFLAIDGGTPGLYGGTNEAGSCDEDLMVGFLESNPDRAEAWADVQGIETAQIAGYLEDLTPVNLGADTRVRNHGFAEGVATPRESVLQRGTAVLVDRQGVPRVNCECGNPLVEPTLEPDEVYAGERWDTFREDVVVVVEPSEVELTTVELTDIRDGRRFERDTGSRGEQDRLRGFETTQADEPEDRPQRDLTAIDGGCGVVVREETGDEFRVQIDGDVDCEEASDTARSYVERDLGSVVDFGPWTCGPATAAGIQEGFAATCTAGHGTINLMFDPDDPPTADAAPPEDEVTPDDRFGEGQSCGVLDGEIGMLGDATAEADALEIIVRGAEPCEIAEEVAQAFLLDLMNWILDPDVQQEFPYEPGVLGWECTSGHFLNPADPEAFFGCRLHNAEIELVPAEGRAGMRSGS